jgi:oligopeptide/dipeptide ABC transporter ATP-binding protein
MPGEPEVFLDISDLTVEVRTPTGWLPVVDRLNLVVPRGQTVGVVGESGSGKSLTALAIMGLLDGVTARVAGGSVRLGGDELIGLSQSQMSQVRGRRIGMIFQEPRRSLHPAFTVGDQIGEVLKRHFKLGRRAARERAIELLDRVGINDAGKRVDAYPFQFSGGMCQRVMLAIALAAEPSFLIADEPTTALDVTVQKRMLDLMRKFQDEEQLSIMLITHDLGVVAEMCDYVAVMYCGQLVEHNALYPLFEDPLHPYTKGLLDSIPSVGQLNERLHAIPGVVPPIATWSRACRFHTRCEYSVAGRCDTEPNPIRAAPNGGFVRCMRAHELHDFEAYFRRREEST